MIKELTSEMSNKSIEKDLIKSLISWKSAENPVTIQTSDTVGPKNLLKEIQREKKNANKYLVYNDFISPSLDTRKSNLTEISNRTDRLHVGNYLSSADKNKHQTDIDNKTAPKLLSATPPPPPPPLPHPNNHHYGS